MNAFFIPESPNNTPYETISLSSEQIQQLQTPKSYILWNICNEGWSSSKIYLRLDWSHLRASIKDVGWQNFDYYTSPEKKSWKRIPYIHYHPAQQENYEPLISEKVNGTQLIDSGANTSTTDCANNALKIINAAWDKHSSAFKFPDIKEIPPEEDL